jgi:hypothetical protein
MASQLEFPVNDWLLRQFGRPWMKNLAETAERVMLANDGNLQGVRSPSLQSTSKSGMTGKITPL